MGTNFIVTPIFEGKCAASGKTWFRTAAEARASIINIKGVFRYLRERHKARHRWGKPSQKRSYYCSHCQGYHLTSWNFSSAKTEKENKAKHRFIVEHILSLVR
jgi:hypothetical protein